METLEIKNILSQNIKKCRKQKSFSQLDLAVQSDVSEQTIASIEGCRLWPSDKTLAKIAEALGVEIYKLFLPQEVGISRELERELKTVVAKSVEKTIAEILKGV